MALTIGRRAGQAFYVEDTKVTVTTVQPSEDGNCRDFTVEVEGGEAFLITEERAEEILPDVLVSAGDGFYSKDDGHGPVDSASVCIQAPRHIRILRAELYRRGDRL